VGIILISSCEEVKHNYVHNRVGKNLTENRVSNCAHSKNKDMVT
jgi:hypothetical protein